MSRLIKSHKIGLSTAEERSLSRSAWCRGETKALPCKIALHFQCIRVPQPLALFNHLLRYDRGHPKIQVCGKCLLKARLGNLHQGVGIDEEGHVDDCKQSMT